MGDDAVICTAGEITLIQKLTNGTQRAGDYAINPKNVCHTADIDDPASTNYTVITWENRPSFVASPLCCADKLHPTSDACPYPNCVGV